jgi:hypothetical protein
MSADKEYDLIVSAIQAANKFDFESCRKFLVQARQSVRERRRAPHGGGADATASRELEQTIEYFRACYEAMEHRVARNPGKALKLYEAAQAKGKLLIDSTRLEEPILRLLRAQDAALPVQLGLCAATESLFVGNDLAARQAIAGAEGMLIVALENIGIDIKRLDTDSASIAADLSAHPPEMVLGLLGVSADFIVTTSIIKLQHCLRTQRYDEEIEQFHWIRGVFDIFAKYDAIGPMFRSDIELLRKLMHLCAAFAEASAALVEGGHKAENGDLVGARECANMARKKLDEASKSVVKVNIHNAVVFQHAILNLKMIQVPNMEIQWENRKAALDGINELQRENAALKHEYRELLQYLLQKGVFTSELNAQIENLESILRQVCNIVAPNERQKIEHATERVKGARADKNVEQKLKTVKDVISDIGGIVEGIGKTVPQAAAAFAFIVKLFGMM